MKKSLFVAAVAALALVSCGGDKKVEEKAENKDTVAEAPADTVAAKVEEGAAKVEEAAKEEVKDAAAKVEEGAAKVEEAAKEVKEEVKK